MTIAKGQHGNTRLRTSFLEAMSQTAATVNVVTTDGAAGRAGITVSSMAPVSADTPRPSLLVCIQTQSAALPVIRENGVFCINVLRSTQELVADVFAGRLGMSAADRFQVAEWRTSQTGAPLATDALAAFDCVLTDTKTVGGHTVLFGDAHAIELRHSGDPLLYGKRGYGTFARTVAAAALEKVAC